MLRALRREGYEVIYEIVDTQDAMRAALERQDWDVITSDHAMPQFSAPAALALAKELRPGVPFIIVSGEIDLNLAVSLMKQGAHDYIQKRELPRLIPAIERELHEAARRRDYENERKRAEENLRTHQLELEMQNEELHRTHRELEISREKYFDLYDLAPVGYLTINEHDLILEVNLTATTLLGSSKGTLIKQSLTHFILPEDQDIYYRLRKRLFESDSPQACELRMRRMNAPSFWVRIEAIRAKDDEGNPVSRIAINDITALKQSEEALRESQAQLKEAHRLAHIGVWQWVMETDTVTWTEEIYRIAGLDPMLPAPSFAELHNIYVPEGMDMLREAVERATKRGEPYQLELKLIRSDGTPRWVNAFGGVTYNDQGRIHGLHGTLQDITDRKQAEEALRQSQEKFRQYFENAPNYIYIVSTEGAILDANPAAVRILGYSSKDELIGRPLLSTVYAPSSRDKARKLLQRWRETGKLENEELRIVTDAGEERTVILNVSAVRDEQGQVLHSVSFQTDITDIKRAELERENLQNQLRQAQKMESVGRLAGGVAHDFNNMLGVILGHTEMALEQVDPAQPIHADLTGILKAAGRSAELIRQLLAFARKQTIAPRVLDLNKTISGMLNMLQRLIGEDISLRWSPAADLWPVKVDPSQIDQILANLCVNVRDAIAGVGKVTIETENSALGEDYCATHGGFVSGEYVRLAVSDSGCGMDKETLSHLYEPFFTTKETGKGTGLGLATVYGIVKQNNGFIHVYSEPGQGTTFTIYLPRHIGKTEQHRREGAPQSVGRGHETILLVEDEPALLELTTKLLKRQSYTVLAASTPGEAIRLAREHRGEINLLMTDVIMPEMNGRDLANNLLALYPHMKRLFMSGYTANVIAHHGVLDEGVHFIQKPFSRKDLADKVREALDQE